MTDADQCHVPGPGLHHVVVTGPGHQGDSPDHGSLLLTREVTGRTPEIEIDSPTMTDIVHPRVTTTHGQSRLYHVTGSVTMHVTHVTTEI